MRGVDTHEMVVAAPASVVWGSYRSLEPSRLSHGLLADVLGEVQVLKGDGSVGTTIKFTIPQPADQTPRIGYIIEKFTTMDDERRVKELETIEGGYLNFGFDYYLVRVEIIEKGEESCIIKSSVVYELDDSKAELVGLITTIVLERMAEKIGSYAVNEMSSVN